MMMINDVDIDVVIDGDGDDDYFRLLLIIR